MPTKKLLLDRETVRNLSAGRLAQVVGGTNRSQVGSDLAHGCATQSCSTPSYSAIYSADCGTLGGSGHSIAGSVTGPTISD